MIQKVECPFCDWSARNEIKDDDKSFIKAYLAKGLMIHLHLKHARHDALHNKETNISISTIMGRDTSMGMIQFSLNDEIIQMDLDKAREVHNMLGLSIEAAVSDWLIYRFFIEKVGFDKEKAARVLMDFREIRHGFRNNRPVS